MRTRLRRLGKYRIKLHIVPLHIAVIKVDKLRFLAGVSISNSQKLIEWIYKKVEGYSISEKHQFRTRFIQLSGNSRIHVLFKFP